MINRKTKSLKLILVLLCLAISVSVSRVLLAEEKAISIKAKDEPICSVLEDIADSVNMGLIVSKDVAGNITVNLKDVSVDKALRLILYPNNLTYVIENNVISVYTYSGYQQRERFSPLQTQVLTLENVEVSSLRRAFMSMKSSRGKVDFNLKGNQIIVTDTPQKLNEIRNLLKEIDKKREVRKYKLKYAEASTIQEKLLKVIPEDVGEIFVDERTNSVIVKAASPLLKNVDELVRGWDIQHKQVLIQAKILKVTLDKTDMLGIDWDSTLNLRGNMTMDFTGDSGDIFQAATLTADEYQITLRMLQSQTDTEVLSSPRVVVVNQQKAKILIGSEEPYIVTTRDPDTGWVTEETKYKDVGLKLEVTPEIGEDNFITMTVHPEVSSSRRLTDVDNSLAVDTTQADTTMMVKDGETVVLGGLMKDTISNTMRKVPLLGDIPLLGYLFRSKNKSKEKTEIVIFITPHILTNENREFISRQDIESTIERSQAQSNVFPDKLFFEQE
jgi:type II secretory pathway component GspD/PulD (secretin)